MAAFTPRQTSRTLHGKPTQVFLQTFADRIMVLVTQIGKVGNLIQVTLPPTIPLNLSARDTAPPDKLFLPEPSPAIQITSLLGSAPSEHLQTLHTLYASQIATIVWTEEAQHGLDGQRRSVVVGLSLGKQEGDANGEREVFEGVMSMVYDLLRSS